MTGYVPGSAIAVVADGTWLLIGVAPGSAVVRRCWELARAGSGLDDVLGALAHDGPRGVGGFALVRWADDERRVVVRGDAVVGVVGPDGVALELHDDGAGPWVDTGLPHEVLEIRLAAGDGVEPPVELPVERGVVPASRLVARAADLVLGAPAQPPDVPAQPPDVPAEVPGASAEAPAQMPAQVPGVPAQPLGAPAQALGVSAQVQGVPVQLLGAPAQFPDRSAEAPTQVLAEGVVRSAVAELPTAVASLPPVGAAAPGSAAPGSAPTPDPPSPGTWPRRGPSPGGPSPGDARHGDPGGVPRVRAVACPARHLNPERAVACRVCGRRLAAQDALVVPRPPLGVLRLSTGEAVLLDRGVDLGRDPQVADRGPARPRAVRFANRGNDISRNHVEVRLDGWDVLVVDLGSRNGTAVIAPGWSPQALAGLVPTPLAPGSRVVLGDGASFTYEVAG